MSAGTMRQTSIEVEGLDHSVPIPVASRVGPIVATSAIAGRDAKTGKLGADADQQARLAFENLKTILAKAGVGLGDVVKMTVFLADEAHRSAIGKYWLECYPDPHHRPARHALVAPLRGGMLLQIDALAVAKDA
jgi:2-iminobutanoate/2-iminopropanoate deaminase